MTPRIRARLQALVGDHPVLGAFQSAETRETVSTTLYTCTACELTYINTEMDSCPRCQESVDKVPSASELGFDSAEKPTR